MVQKKKAHCRDSEATRCAALDAAQHLFAEKGFAGTSMRDIAVLSGVSQPLIHYHFGSKEGLYRAVKERLSREGMDSVKSDADGLPDKVAGPSELVRTAFKYFLDNEDLTRLISWSHLERDNNEWPGEQEFTRLLAERIQRHQDDAASGRKLDPFVAAIMVESLIVFWSQHYQYYAAMFDKPQAQFTDRFLDHIDCLFFPSADRMKKE